MNSLLKDLQILQKEFVDLFPDIPDQDFNRQFHTDLSPLGWHLGHCVYTECYWVQERLLKTGNVNESLKSLYVPELSIKEKRGSAIPDKQELIEWAKETQLENLTCLEQYDYSGNDILMEEDFLIHFLIQHYSQHFETIMMVLTERQLSMEHQACNTKSTYKDKNHRKLETIAKGTYQIGSNNHCFYDNERPMIEVDMKEIRIATLPVSNLEYLEFITEGGYKEKQNWSEPGWNWIQSHQFECPNHWQKSKSSEWMTVHHDGAFELDPNEPVQGLSYFEAEAFAKWAGARLPNEYEWEVASLENKLEQTGCVWEWCANTFHPYPGFTAFPYDGYSIPYFDHKHFVLRGGSINTKKSIRRSSFRNYYQAEKRHIFAGLRLVFD